MNFKLVPDPLKYCKKCSKIIYEDITDFLENIPLYNSLYSSLTSYNLRSSSNKFGEMLLLYLNLISSFKNLDDAYIYYMSNRKWFHKECTSCYNNTTYEMLQRMIKDTYNTKLFEFLTNKAINKYIMDFLDENLDLKQIIRKRLIYFNLPHQVPMCYIWKGSDYYYKKIFGYPIYLKDIEIPREFTNIRNSTYFEDIIAGHPKASHGWYMDALNNLIEMKVIKE